MTTDRIADIEKELQKEKIELLKNIESHSQVKNFGDDLAAESEMSEKTDEAEEFSNDLAIAAAYRDRLEEVENALNMIKEGKFGTCQTCGGKISDTDLEEEPTRMQCASCRK